MLKERKFYQKVLQFNDKLSKTSLLLPDNYRMLNPFIGEQKNLVNEISTIFYKKFYNDTNKRQLILGSSPARRGTAVTGISFEDAEHLKTKTGISIQNFYVNKSSSNFLYDVIEEYGGCEKFYSKFYMSFVCPLGIVRTNYNGNEVNCNYYDNKKLENALYQLIICSLKEQISFGIDTSVCYCIGSGENYKFLERINKEYNFFKKIIPLEHPRFIMQYNSRQKDQFLKKYLTAFRSNGKSKEA